MKAIIFDLDNTLYDSYQYFSGAFSEISEYLSKKYSISKEDINKRLIDHWKIKTSMYPYLFDDTLALFGLKKEIESVVKIFNKSDKKLIPYPDVIPMLKELKKRNHMLGIITDGNAERQKRKITLLGLEKFFNIIIFTNELKCSKQSVIPFEKIIQRMNVKPENSFFVGDNPLIDFEGAKKLGVNTIRILRGEFKTIPKNYYIDHEIKEYEELLGVIDND